MTWKVPKKKEKIANVDRVEGYQAHAKLECHQTTHGLSTERPWLHAAALRPKSKPVARWVLDIGELSHHAIMCLLFQINLVEARAISKVVFVGLSPAAKSLVNAEQG